MVKTRSQTRKQQQEESKKQQQSKGRRRKNRQKSPSEQQSDNDFNTPVTKRYNSRKYETILLNDESPSVQTQKRKSVAALSAKFEPISSSTMLHSSPGRGEQVSCPNELVDYGDKVAAATAQLNRFPEEFADPQTPAGSRHPRPAS